MGNSFSATLFASVRNNVVPIFMLHRMHAPDLGLQGHSPKFLDDALRYLVNNKYSFISLAELIQCLNGDMELPKNAVAFTCDDGFWDQAEITAPILEKYDCPLTVFLITGFIDGELWPWDDRVAHVLRDTQKSAIDIVVDNNRLHLGLATVQAKEHALHLLRERLKACEHAEFLRVMEYLDVCAEVEATHHPPDRYRPLTWEQARALEKKNVQFAPHTVTHAILSRTSDVTAHYEINHSWQRLQQELENPLPVFCYPTGRASDFTSREMELVERAGFELAVSTTPGYVNIKKDGVRDRRYQLNRFGFPDTLADLVQYASWIERAKEIVRRQ